MQFIFPFILIGALGLGVIILVWLGLSQRRRERKLSRLAYQMDMRFSASDPFALVKRYASSPLFQAGHSPRARNVIYGRFRGWLIKAFDYQFEAGHGTHRLTHRYNVITAETNLSIPNVLLWNTKDNEPPPLISLLLDRKINGWYLQGDVNFANTLAKSLDGFESEMINAETFNGIIMIYIREHGKPSQIGNRIIRLVDALAKIRKNCIDQSDQ